MPPKEKKNNSRAYVHAFMLFPDSEEHAKLLRFLRDGCHPGMKFLGIVHQPEEAEKKEHIHCMVCFDSQRTPDGVRKSFGVIRTVWRLAHMQLHDTVSEKLKKIPDGSDFTSDTGYYRVEKWKDNETYVLSDPDDPQSYIETPYKDGEKQCRSPCEIDEVWRLCPVWRIPHVEVVSDRCSYAQYMLHRDIQSTIDGVKHVYNYSDIFGDEDFKQSCFPVPKAQSENTLVQDILALSADCYSFRDFVTKCANFQRDDLISFAMSHSYYITQILPKFPIQNK